MQCLREGVGRDITRHQFLRWLAITQQVVLLEAARVELWKGHGGERRYSHLRVDLGQRYRIVYPEPLGGALYRACGRILHLGNDTTGVGPMACDYRAVT